MEDCEKETKSKPSMTYILKKKMWRGVSLLRPRPQTLESHMKMGNRCKVNICYDHQFNSVCFIAPNQNSFVMWQFYNNKEKTPKSDDSLRASTRQQCEGKTPVWQEETSGRVRLREGRLFATKHGSLQWCRVKSIFSSCSKYVFCRKGKSLFHGRMWIVWLFSLFLKAK